MAKDDIYLVGAAETTEPRRLTRRWFLAWLIWGTVGGLAVWFADGVPIVGALWWFVGLAIGWWGETALDRTVMPWVRRAVRHDSDARFTAIIKPGESDDDLAWIDRRLHSLGSFPPTAFPEFVLICVLFGMTWGLFVGPLAGLFVVFDPDWHDSALQGALWSTVLCVPLVGLTAGSVIAIMSIFLKRKRRNVSLAYVKTAVKRAAQQAALLRNAHVGPGHLFLALLSEQNSPVAELMMSKGLTLEAIRAAVAKQIAANSSDSLDPEDTRIDDDLRWDGTLERAYLDTLTRKHKAVKADHLLLALVGGLGGSGVVANVLNQLGIEVAALEEELGERLDKMAK